MSNSYSTKRDKIKKKCKLFLKVDHDSSDFILSNKKETGSANLHSSEYCNNLYNIKCNHCDKPIYELHAPLTCGCIICDCMCENWSKCPKITSK